MRLLSDPEKRKSDSRALSTGFLTVKPPEFDSQHTAAALHEHRRNCGRTPRTRPSCACPLASAAAALCSRHAARPFPLRRAQKSSILFSDAHAHATLLLHEVTLLFASATAPPQRALLLLLRPGSSRALAFAVYLLPRLAVTFLASVRRQAPLLTRCALRASSPEPPHALCAAAPRRLPYARALSCHTAAAVSPRTRVVPDEVRHRTVTLAPFRLRGLAHAHVCPRSGVGARLPSQLAYSCCSSIRSSPRSAFAQYGAVACLRGRCVLWRTYAGDGRSVDNDGGAAHGACTSAS